jgi:hypothetical protein
MEEMLVEEGLITLEDVYKNRNGILFRLYF